MKLKEGFVLRKILGDAIVIAEGEMSKSFHGMIKLNDTAADIWEWFAEGKSEEEAAVLLAEKYEISVDEASGDVRAVAEKLIAAGIMEA
ncbi:MAG: PqqD family protein [Oscillospiraceae bacterium]|nr:PqqD family protein [Oscillospiraceae bacterium]